ncbi:MAG: hypothetical protein ABI846_13250 [Rudaea sp.]
MEILIWLSRGTLTNGVAIAMTDTSLQRYGSITIIALTLCACHALKPPDAPSETRVAYRASIAAGTPRYEEAEDEVANRPAPAENPAPIYPPSALALHLPRVVVEAKVIVNREGRVGEVRIAASTDAGAHPAVFDAAVRDAASRWRFTPLTFTRWQDVTDAQGNVVDSRQVSAERRPFSLDYAFFFELLDGKPVVGAQSRTGDRRN